MTHAPPASLSPTYALEVTAPANTTKSSPVRDEIVLERGVRIREIRLHVPAGVKALAGARFALDGAPIVPINPDRWLARDNVPDLVIPVGLLLDRRQTFAFEVYNEDDTYPHTLRAVVSVELGGGRS